jgi:predicted GH43/DUF377 family glycosyl hydrolase
MLRRVEENPLLGPEDLAPTAEGRSVMCTLNPAAVRFGDQILLLVRVGEQAPEEDGYVTYLRYDPAAEKTVVGRLAKGDPDLDLTDPRGYYYKGKMLLTSLSHLRIARSSDGRNFTFDPQPAIYPATPYEAYGCEDPRITHIDGTYYITYTAVSDRGVAVGLASTTDFAHFDRHPLIFPPYQKDVCLFPETIDGRYVCRHRPYKNEFNDACIWTAYSPDLLCWGLHELTLAPRPDSWEEGRVGCGAAPIRTDAGWLEIYHAADAAGRYHLGAMLSDLQQPQRVIARGSQPVLQPQADYERTGVYGNCVFSNGLIADDDGTLTVYYGAADRICAAAVTTIDEMIAAANA